MPSLSTTKADRLDTPFISNTKSSYKQSYARLASLLKSDNRGKFNFCSSLNFSNVNKEDVLECLKFHVKKNFEMNTLGARLINTLIHQYFIKGGKIEDTVKEVTFQTNLKF